MEIVNGWLIYKTEDDSWAIDDECGNIYYAPTHKDAVDMARELN